MQQPRSNLLRHIQLVVGFHIAFGVLGLLLAFAIFIFVAGGGFLSGARRVVLVTSTLAFVASGFLILLALVEILGGVGLLKRRQWGRVMVLIMGFFNLMNFPLGTILGIYTTWVLLLHEEAESYFRPADSSGHATAPETWKPQPESELLDWSAKFE